MKLKREIWFSLVLFCISNINAQDFDRQIFSDADIVGTARYVAMGGAFGALGGDVSAVQDNPAALGVFRRGEVSLTMDYAYDRVGSDESFDHISRVTVPQVSWVINFGSDNTRQRGLLTSSMILQYHRLKSFKRNAAFASTETVSLTDLMSDLTNGLIEAQLQDTYWDTGDVGTLSEAAYQLYLINPSTDNPQQWHSVLEEGEKSQFAVNTEESGNASDYSVAWGANISNRVYAGIGVGLRSLSYSRITTIAEEFEHGGNYSLQSSLTASGLGVSGSVGIIVRPADFIRLGLSYQTPAWMTLTTRSFTRGSSNISGNADFRYSPDSYTDRSYTLPMRTTVGLAFQVEQCGVVSAEYDWTHQYKTLTEDVHRIKIGTEWVVKQNCFLRAGYAVSSSFYDSVKYLNIGYTDIRTDTDFKNRDLVQYFSAGIGFRNRYVIAEFAYQCRYEKSRYYAFARPLYSGSDTAPAEWQSVGYDMNAATHLFVFSLGWTPRR